MAFDAQNIGKARLKVLFMPNSPFNAIPQQEFSYYFTPDNLASMGSRSFVTALPQPFNGFRIEEDVENYDNYLTDPTGIYLENAVYQSNGATVPVDTGAQSAARAAAKERPGQKTVQRDFFTWIVAENLFVTSTAAAAPTGSPSETTTQTTNANVLNPGPVPFSVSKMRNDNTPTWTYNLAVKPGSGSNSSALTPFMNRSTSSTTKPIHWGCKMKTALARNQPFEFLFYHDRILAAIADQAAPNALKPKFSGLEDLQLTKKSYFALEMGLGTQFHFLFMLVRDMPPRFYQLTGSNQTRKATLISEFGNITGEKLFDPENSYITFKVEPVAAGLLVTSNKFDEQPWVINWGGDTPYFVGEGPLAIYSGNVQAGFLMRPVQYHSEGSFTTPPTTVVQTADDSRTPTITTAIKGFGEVEQIASYNDGESSVHAVDAEREKVVGQGGNSKIRTFIEAETGQQSLLSGTRQIQLTLIKSTSSSNDPAAQAPANGPPNAGTNIKKTDYSCNVTLQAADLVQGNGYVVVNGRSPYIWQLFMILEQRSNGQPVGQGIDISCYVLSCDLAFNATSYNELSHTGTIRVLNKPRQAGAIDFRGYINRAIYVKIFAWWEKAANDGTGGFDPGNDNGRQIFEGMSIGATVDTERERETVTFKLEDYMNALEGGKFILSPFYDGMAAPLAVRDIVAQLGIADSKMLGGGAALGNSDVTKSFVLPFNTPFDEPQFHFKDGSSYKSAVVRIAQLDGKVVFFDNNGNFHYDPIPGGIFGDENTSSVVDFFSNIQQCPTAAQAAWKLTSFTRAINDTYNVLQVVTIDKDTGDIVSIADANDAALHDPMSEGYLGYRKHLLIKDPSLGSVAAAGRYFNDYRNRIFIPPLTVRFETYGYSGLKPLDTITLDGQKMRVLNIQLHLDAKENQYWMNIEGEWFFSAGKWQSQNVNSLGTGSPSE